MMREKIGKNDDHERIEQRKWITKELIHIVTQEEFWIVHTKSECY